ncbi:mannan endo-1,4-beta-mannosidase [Streptohalobacillus salinus]|uniref:Mannan endo-1,4-beta-mannosidase n=1 Tax=Streptohalobacillus salinus TaxID=621096 RepID=A0A2V3WG40_9BACI|nr:glycosyl hydrolase [Streptohalobacillus salinus]PXW92223.1 mannan endo-1,4-beta-mannosidase [Streptohalobacillus salinus]
MKNMMKYLASIMVALIILTMVPTMNIAVSAQEETLYMSNPNASLYTKELFAYLKGVGSDQILFGQQHASDEGLTLTEAGNRVGSTTSEVENAVGSHPAVFGWDTNSLDGRERPGNAIDDVSLTQSERIENLVTSMKTAHALGGIITLSMHPNNFVTGGSYGDTEGDVVKAILPGGQAHTAFNAWLDQLVALSHQVVDQNGEAIPIIFRPFHEQTGSWFWWGESSTTPEAYQAIFRYTVEYLHAHGNNNFLIGYSPGAGPSGDKARYFKTYPGDDYVDILGIDSYDNKENAGSKAWIDSVAEDLDMLAKGAKGRGKVSAFTEFGYSATGMNQSGNNLSWWTDVLDGIMNHETFTEASETSYMLTWANFGFPNNMYVPYRDINDDLGGDHELLADFQAFHDDQRTVFAASAEIFNQGLSYQTIEHEPLMYVVSPTEGQTITEAPVRLRARVVNGSTERVTYQIEGGAEQEMLAKEGYYLADWQPDANDNGAGVDVTYRYYEQGDLVTEQTHRYYLALDEVAVKMFTFDENIQGIKNNGTYSAQETEVTLDLSHHPFNGGALELIVGNMDESQWWQELKLELTDLEAADLMAVNSVSYDVYVPVSAGEKQLSNIVMLPPDWETKYEQTIELADQPVVTIDAKAYYHAEVKVNLPTTTVREGLAISLVGKQMQMNEPIYIDNIRLLNQMEKETVDPWVIDTFESYLGEDALLDRAYSSNGDPIQLALSESEKVEGSYGLKYEYMLGAQGYAGRQKSLAGVDWTGANGIEFYLKHPPQVDRHLTVQIQIGGVSFETNVDLDETFDGTVSLPFSAFKPAHWETNQAAIIDQDRIQRVTQFALYMGGEQGEGKLHFDDFRAAELEGEADVPMVEAPSEGPVKPIVYRFDESDEGFSGADFTLNEGALVVNVDLAGKTEVKRSGMDLTKYNYLVGRVKLVADTTLPQNILQGKLFVKTGDDWTWHDSGATALVQDGYVDVVFDLTSINQKDTVRELGFEFSGSGEGVAEVMIDQVSIVESLEDLEEAEVPEETPEPDQNGQGNEKEDNEESTEEGPESIIQVDESTTLINKEATTQVLAVEEVGSAFVFTEAFLNAQDKAHWIEVTDGSIDVRLPVRLLTGHGEVTFIIDDITARVKEKYDNWLSRFYDFHLTDGDGAVIDFDGERVGLVFRANQAEEIDIDDLVVAYLDDHLAIAETLTALDYDETNGHVYVEVNHFSSYGVLGVTGEVDEERDQVTGQQLPDTASMTYQLLWVGISLLTVGALLFIIRKRLE